MKNIEVMKNITTIKKTNMEKTTIAKITAKITTTALLFFLALFTLTTNLKAQAQFKDKQDKKEQPGKKRGLVYRFYSLSVGSVLAEELQYYCLQSYR